jgi:hypothetical protein
MQEETATIAPRITISIEATQLWEQIKPKIDALITHRINLFHDAMVERGQIKAMPAPSDPHEESADHS